MGVIGCADIAVRRVLPAIVANSSAQLVAVASRRSEQAAQVGAQFGCAGVVGYERLIERGDIDAVYIPLPPALHHRWVSAALRAGKHVLCEKPLSTSYEETRELLALSRSRRLVLAENFMFLHHSLHDRVRSVLDRGAVGDVHVFASSFGVPPLDTTGFRYQPMLGGGALLDVGVYPLRAAQLYLSTELTALAATLRVDVATGVDIAGSALLSTPDGAAAQLDFGFAHSYRSRYALWGNHGRVSVDRAFTPPQQHKPLVRIQQQDRLTEIAMPADDQVDNALNAFVGAVRSGLVGPVGEEAALCQARLVEEVRRVARVARSTYTFTA